MSENVLILPIYLTSGTWYQCPLGGPASATSLHGSKLFLYGLSTCWDVWVRWLSGAPLADLGGINLSLKIDEIDAMSTAITATASFTIPMDSETQETPRSKYS